MSIDLTKLISAPWFVNYSEETDDYGNGPAGLAIGPHEEDFADTFMFSQNFSAAEGTPEELETAFEFVVLARDAFDVMLRRGWHCGKHRWDRQWTVYAGDEKVVRTGMYCKTSEEYCRPFLGDDPFSPLIEADKWHRENAESSLDRSR
jgi:hypothetical protein